VRDDGGLDNIVEGLRAQRASDSERHRREDEEHARQTRALHQQLEQAIRAFMERAGPPPHTVRVPAGTRTEAYGFLHRKARTVAAYKERRAWQLQRGVPSHGDFPNNYIGQPAIWLTEDGVFLHANGWGEIFVWEVGAGWAEVNERMQLLAAYLA
jgi:hypothetical protein